VRVYGWLPAKLGRRIVSLAAAFVGPAVTVGAMLTFGVPAASAADKAGTPGAVSVAIDSMSPQYAKPGSTVRLTGTVTNGTSQARSGLVVQLYTSSEVFSARDQMDFYLTKGGNKVLAPVGNPFSIAGSLKPGATASWTASFDVDNVGITAFGVYPVAAQVTDPAGATLASVRTLLPFWPGSSAAGLRRPLNIAWAWPLIDQPHHQACPNVLTDNDLAASLAPGGRLSVLLAAGQAHPDADLTWFVDPALLSDVTAMTSHYEVGLSWACTGATPEPASKAATRWLSALRTTAAQQQQTVITAYANVDMTALVHQGLTADLGRAFQAGDTVAHAVLHGTFRPSIAWPTGGTADLSVLTDLAASEHIGTVMLGSNEMPPTASPVYHGEDAVTSIRTGAGTTMNVLLADDTLTGVLRSGSGALSRSSEFAVKQRFLAETAMIAAEEPNSARSIVVAPPQNWNPTAALAGGLLDETVSTPWLAPATLDGLTTAQDSGRTTSRQPPRATKASPGELGRSYLSQVTALGGRLGLYKSILYQPQAGYVPSLYQALAATESSAWRGGGQAQGAAMVDTLSQYLVNAEKKVRIITSAQVSMGGTSGAVPVNIQNELHQAIQVWLTTSVLTTPGQTTQLTIGRFQNRIVVQPFQIVTVRLPVSSAPIGSTQIKLHLSNANGAVLPYSDASLTVESTRYGRAILFLIGTAIGVLVLTSLYRAVRRWLHDDTRGAVQEAEAPGSVVTGSSGTSGARHPTEAPDDLADARRWADDA
jgi:hypothetical protein